MVVADDEKAEKPLREPTQAEVAQSVTYKTAVVEKVTDMTDALNVSIIPHAPLLTVSRLPGGRRVFRCYLHQSQR